MTFIPLKTIKHFLLDRYSLLLGLLPLKKMIVFESQSDMDDNPRAVFDYMLEQGLDREYKLVWIVKDVESCCRKYQGRKVRFVNRADGSVLNQMRLQDALSRAHWFVFSHPWWYHKRRETQVVINTGHGVPLKGAASNPQIQLSFDYLIAPTLYSGEWFSRFWYTPMERIKLCGAPRNDDLFVENGEKILSDLFSCDTGEKVILCMPTFRQSAFQTDCKTIDTYCLSVVKNEEELSQLNDCLRKNRIHLVVKPHPLQITDHLLMNNLSNIHYINNECLKKKEIKLYNLIGCCDAILTDFSSVYFDYMILNRPIGFFTGEIESYSRGFVIEDPLSCMPGERIECFEDMLSFVRHISEGQDPWREERMRLNRLVNGAYTQKISSGTFVKEFF